MAETNKSKMMSEAEIIEAINADTLVSVSLGEGQPQKNVKLSTLASVVAGIIGSISDVKEEGLANTSVISIAMGRLEQKDFFANSLNFLNIGRYLFNASSIIDSSSPITTSSLWVLENINLYNGVYIRQTITSISSTAMYLRVYDGSNWHSWAKII